MRILKTSDKCRSTTSAGKKRILLPFAAAMLAFVLMLEPTASALAAEAASAAGSSSSSEAASSGSSSETSSYYREDDGTTGTVTLQYPVSGAEFSIYLVGTANEDGGYTLDQPFSDYDVLLTSSQAATTLADYVQRDTAADADEGDSAAEADNADEGDSADEADNSDSEEADAAADIEPLATARSDKDGIVKFTDLHRGVYLIIGGSIEKDGWTYTASPILFELPNLQKISGTNNYEEIWDLTIDGKYEKKETPITPEEETTELKVLKVWKSDDEDSRPESITVQLLCNGKLSDREDAEVVLNKENGWTYEWTDLAADQEWTAVEKTVPDGYKVSRTKDGTSIVITNTKSTPSTPENPDNPSDSNNTTTKKTTKLPQTGQLWWPVTVLIAVGLFFILIGLLLHAPEGR